MKTLSRFLIVIILISGRAWSQPQPVAPDSVQLRAWEDFKSVHGEDWVIRWRPETGVPSMIFSSTTTPFSGTPQEIAFNFLQDNHELFKMKPDLSDLSFMASEKVDGVHHLEFRQTYQGVSVEDADFLVHIWSDGRVDMVNGTYYPEISIPMDTVVTAKDAVILAEQDLGGNVALRGDISQELVVYPHENAFYLAWKLSIPASDPFGSWRYYIDAANGVVLFSFNLINFGFGNGDVYPTHPDSSSVTTHKLLRLNGSGYLQGTYAKVLNDEGPEAKSPNLSFFYDPADTHFDEVNVYYHIDRFRDQYIRKFGFNKFKQLTAKVHFQPDPFNAWYDPLSRQLWFGDGGGNKLKKDFAKEDKVIYHEYFHAVMHKIKYLNSEFNNDEGAIAEGLPDYFAGSFTRRSLINEYAASKEKRNMAKPKIKTFVQYNVPVEPHKGGEFFSAILWDFRNDKSISVSNADLLIYRTTDNRISGNPKFLEFRDGLVAEDLAKFKGKNVSAIKGAFYNRYIPGAPPAVNISGPASLWYKESGTWTAKPSGGNGSYSYEWRYRY